MRHGVQTIPKATKKARKTYAQDLDGDKVTKLEAMATMYSEENERNKYGAEYLPLKMAENAGRIGGVRVCGNRKTMNKEDRINFNKSRCTTKEKRKLIMVKPLKISSGNRRAKPAVSC